MDQKIESKSTRNLGKGLAHAAIQALLESRGLKLEDIKPDVAHCKKNSEAIARLEKEKKLQEFAVFSSRVRLSFNDKNFKKLNELAIIESNAGYRPQPNSSMR